MRWLCITLVLSFLFSRHTLNAGECPADGAAAHSQPSQKTLRLFAKNPAMKKKGH